MKLYIIVVMTLQALSICIALYELIGGEYPRQVIRSAAQDFWTMIIAAMLFGIGALTIW